MISATILRILPLSALVLASGLSAQQQVSLPVADRALTGQPVTIATIGGTGASERLGKLVTFDFDSDDNLYVLDAMKRRVYVYDRDGRLVREFGRQGSAQGEFLYPLSLTVLADNSLYIVDHGRRAAARYSREGEFLNEIAFPMTDVPSSVPPRAHPRDDIVRSRLVPIDFGELQASVMNGTPIDMGRATQIVADPLRPGAAPARLFEHGNVRESHALDIDAGLMTSRIKMPVTVHFEPQLRWDVLPDGGLAVSNVAQYVIKVVSSEGNLTRTITRAIEPRPVTPADRERRVQAQRNMPDAVREVTDIEMSPRATAMLERMNQQMSANAQFAAVHPVVAGLRTDRFGTLWVERDVESGLAIDLVRPDGTYLGTIRDLELPAAFSRSGRIADLEEGENGAPSRIVIRQLPASWR